jgi:hypothetical protein
MGILSGVYTHAFMHVYARLPFFRYYVGFDSLLETAEDMDPRLGSETAEVLDSDSGQV